MKTLPYLMLLLLSFGVTSQGKQKQWTEWTTKDADKILNDSPWGQTQVGKNMAYEDYGLPVSRVNLRIRFLSARPIRQALLRMLELSPTKAEAGQIEEAQHLLNRTFPETIVVSVCYDAPAGSLPLGAYFQAFAGATTGTLKNNTYLDTKGGRRLFLQQYVPPGPDGLGAKFIFPRSDGSRPFVTSAADSVRFYCEFPKQAGTTMTGGSPIVNKVSFTIDMRFKIADFLYDGVLEY